MITDRAPALGLSEAVSNTFSGDHPCDICKALAEVTEQEKEQAPSPLSAENLVKIDSPLSQKRTLVFPPDLGSWPYALSDIHHLSVSLKVLTPPPEIA